MFSDGLRKTAKAKLPAKGIMNTVSNVAKGVGEVAKGAKPGFTHALNQPLKEHLKLSPLFQKAEGVGLKTQKGRARLGEEIGKRAPAALAAGAYAVGAKKVYDKAIGSNGAYTENNYY